MVEITTKHILVVEDEAHLASGIKYNLEAEGFRVSVVEEGPSALRVVEKSKIDLVILDIMLPGMSGYSVCESLRDGGYNMPILVLSARTLPEDRARGFDVGADQYMMKPFDLDEFISRVRGLMRLQSRRAQNESEALPMIRQFADATIDFNTYEVTVRGEPVRLTQLEMRLLRYFLENEGRVIPRYELLENVWEMQGTVNTRAPDQFIRRLRKIFEPDPSNPRHFLTIRDAGYRFLAEGTDPEEV
ncbi:MAG: response regulator transcription factor [Planctomycetia bacterium]|jgi:two-component system OmpR family response regulator